MGGWLALALLADLDHELIWVKARTTGLLLEFGFGFDCIGLGALQGKEHYPTARELWGRRKIPFCLFTSWAWHGIAWLHEFIRPSWEARGWNGLAFSTFGVIRLYHGLSAAVFSIWSLSMHASFQIFKTCNFSQ